MCGFGQGHPEKVIDYGWRAIHIMTDTAKLIVRNAQGKFADYSYFVGCSAGRPSGDVGSAALP
jgi:feruloyl esterase